MFNTPTPPTKGTLLEKHLQLAIRAHNGTSHSPERRGASYIASYSEELQKEMDEIKSIGGDPNEYREKYERLFVSWLSAKSNCLSTMIAGRSGFPVRRAEKANRTEQKRYTEFSELFGKVTARLRKNQRREAKAALDPVQDMTQKIERAEKTQELYKAGNKIIRSKISDVEKIEKLAGIGFSEKLAIECLTPDFCGRVGFPSYLLTNNLANIKRMHDRLVILKRRAAAETTETERPDGITVTENTEIDRLQIFFPGKPDDEKRTQLKKSGWRWSPSNGCWQRQLTNAARESMSKILG